MMVPASGESNSRILRPSRQMLRDIYENVMPTNVYHFYNCSGRQRRDCRVINHATLFLQSLKNALSNWRSQRLLQKAKITKPPIIAMSAKNNSSSLHGIVIHNPTVVLAPFESILIYKKRNSKEALCYELQYFIKERSS